MRPLRVPKSGQADGGLVTALSQGFLTRGVDARPIGCRVSNRGAWIMTKQRNVRRREAHRYLIRERAAGRWLYYKISLAAECRDDNHLPRWHREHPMQYYVEDWQ